MRQIVLHGELDKLEDQQRDLAAKIANLANNPAADSNLMANWVSKSIEVAADIADVESQIQREYERQEQQAAQKAKLLAAKATAASTVSSYYSPDAINSFVGNMMSGLNIQDQQLAGQVENQLRTGQEEFSQNFTATFLADGALNDLSVEDGILIVESATVAISQAENNYRDDMQALVDDITMTDREKAEQVLRNQDYRASEFELVLNKEAFTRGLTESLKAEHGEEFYMNKDLMASMGVNKLTMSAFESMYKNDPDMLKAQMQNLYEGAIEEAVMQQTNDPYQLEFLKSSIFKDNPELEGVWRESAQRTLDIISNLPPEYQQLIEQGRYDQAAEIYKATEQEYIASVETQQRAGPPYNGAHEDLEGINIGQLASSETEPEQAPEMTDIAIAFAMSDNQAQTGPAAIYSEEEIAQRQAASQGQGA